ncbi:hypothetical protein AAFF_G00186330 [Aldrovandia affinis]|uniref:Uncharacterized protein n=1 Tax=Aldrovandia affinis TaxID=143900 RepID=A0AAD7SZQ3_9TELE|nr:hypothetical protein AAFF_G00186330 [Aldrovandia affinis]
MLKNVALARYFGGFDRAEVLGRRGGAGVYVDVWPVNLLRPDSSSYVDTCSLFLLQLACVLNMVRAWRRARLRLFLCVEEGRSLRGPEEKLGQLLKDLRISADVHTVPWDQVAALHWQRQGDRGRLEQRGRRQAAAAGRERRRLRQQLPQQRHPAVGRVPAGGEQAGPGAGPPSARREVPLPAPPARRHPLLPRLPAPAGAAHPRPGAHAAHPRGHARHHHRPLTPPPACLQRGERGALGASAPGELPRDRATVSGDRREDGL